MKEQMITIQYYLNGNRQEHQIPAGITVLDMLHQYHKAFGTKKGCREGDCGACTVAVGEWLDGHFIYQAIASCIYPAIKLHGKHLITIEGLAKVDSLHLIQEKIVNHHGAQCGYCTPGIIMSLFCLFAMKAVPTNREISLALEGNICRCTGYEGIRKAGQAVVKTLEDNPDDWESEILPYYARDVEQELLRTISSRSPVMSEEENQEEDNERAYSPVPVAAYYMPATMEELFSLLNRFDHATVIAGGTDIYVGINAGRVRADRLVDISMIDGLSEIEVNSDVIRIGSQVRISRVIEHEGLLSVYPVFKSVGDQVASRQIRNAATIAGNIANASPIGDFSVLLLALDASVELQGEKGRRVIPLSDFFIDYKKTDLKRHEIISAVEIPVRPAMHILFEKSSKRKAVDIASVNSCCAAVLEDGRIVSCRIAFGGIAPTPVAVTDTEELTGRAVDDQIIAAFADRIKEQFPVISDIRGSEEFRRILVRNHIIRYLGQLMNVLEGE